jgi:hypothetical protein
MTPPPAIKPATPRPLLKDWSSGRLSAVVEAAYLLEVAGR